MTSSSSDPVAQWPSDPVRFRALRHCATTPLSERGQALTEMAVMGFLGLLALGFMLQVGLRGYYQLEIEQASFRRAQQLAKAERNDDESAAVSYNQIRDRQIPNPVDPFGIMPRVRTEGRGTVTWGERLTYLADNCRGCLPKIIIDLNGERKDYRSEDFDTGEDDAPLVTHIQNRFEVTRGTTTQLKRDSALPAVTERDIDTQWTSTVTLKNGDEISSTVSAGCTFRDRLLWRCDRD